MFNLDHPIVLGLAGGAATGKTTAANALAPAAALGVSSDPISWTHMYYAIPIYRMAAARQKIVGVDATDRQRYEIHDALVDLFKGYITYDETVDTVYEIVAMDCPIEGKPRSFLQHVGTEILREFDPDCFVKWIDRKIKEEHVRFEQEQSRLEEMHELTNLDEPFFRKTLGVVISDARFMNECYFVQRHPNGVLIKLVADEDVVRERIANRDGISLNAQQQTHRSEQELSDVPEEWFDAVIDTSYLEEQEKVAKILEVVRSHAQN